MKTKKTTLLTVLIFALNFTLAHAQSACVSGSSVVALDANNAKAYLPNNGNLWSKSSNEGGYVFPNNDSGIEVAAIFTAGLWFGGVNPEGDLKLSATTYDAFSGTTPYTPGPLDPNTGTANIETCVFWDLHFQTTQSDIESFLQDWSDGALDNDIPNSILGWPARGNASFIDIHGFDLPDTGQGLAPFWDENFDGIYNPESGDYPNIKGATQAIWWVFNNSNSENYFPALSPQLEIQMMAYAYNSSNESVNNSTFYDVKYINRGMEALDSMFVSLWIDQDLGCFTDDYVGCVPDENMAFIYNADAVDGEVDCSCPQGIPTYCQAPPVIGIKVLKGPLAERLTDGNGGVTVPPIGVSGDTLVEVGLSSFIYYATSTVGIPPQIGDPSTGLEYYNYMNGRFRDNSQIINNNGQATNYAYSGNPSNPEEWSMCSENTSLSLDRRFLLNMGGLRMQPSSVNELTFCVTGIENVDYPCPDIGVLTDAMNEVKDLWEGNNIPVSTKPIVNSSSLSIFPNPMTTSTQIELQDANDRIRKVELFNVSGQSVLLQNNLDAHNAVINREQLQSGIYFYTILTKKQKLFSGKIIIE